MHDSDLQHRLDSVYSDFRESISMPPHEAARFSAPLLINIPTDWLGSKHRMMIFGKETRGWGLDKSWTSPNRDATSGGNKDQLASYRNDGLMNLRQFLEQPDSLSVLKYVYDAFDLGRDQNIIRYEGDRIVTKSQFWRAFHQLMVTAEGPDRPRAALWSNFTISDLEEGSVLNGGASLARKFLDLQRSVLKSQIQILRPGAAIFLVGSHYKYHLTQYFPGLELEELHAGQNQILVARSAPDPLPAKTAWCAHPRSWERATWDELLPALAEWVAQA